MNQLALERSIHIQFREFFLLRRQAMHRKSPERALGLVLDKAVASPDEILFLRRYRDREIIFDAFQLDRKVRMVLHLVRCGTLDGILFQKPGRQ